MHSSEHPAPGFLGLSGNDRIVFSVFCFAAATLSHLRNRGERGQVITMPLVPLNVAGRKNGQKSGVNSLQGTPTKASLRVSA
jgi:hypothetical protein